MKRCGKQRWGVPGFNDIFYRENQPVLYMAGLYNRYRDEDRLTEGFLQKTPALLERRADFEQMSLFPVENSNQRK